MLDEFSNCLTRIHSYITAYSISRPFNRARNVFKNVFNEDRILIFTAKVQIESGSKIVQSSRFDAFTLVGVDGVAR